MKIYGDISGLKAWHKQRLLHFYESGGCSFFPQDPEFLLELSTLSADLEKEIGVLLDKKGKVHGVFLGDHRSITMPSSPEGVDVSIHKLGFLHTHPNSSGHLSQLDETAFEQIGYAWIAALGAGGQFSGSLGIRFGSSMDTFTGFYTWADLFEPAVQSKLEEAWVQEKKIPQSTTETESEEKILLVGVEMPRSWPIQESLAELAELVDTAGGKVVGTITQKRDKPENATFLGQGKIGDVVEAIQVKGVRTVVFDDELTGVQQRNLENFLGCKVLDRTALILDIFAQRARSYEGKIQVELAQLQYQLTRLTGRGTMMSRLGGGIGTRGPGETKLEMDRRRIHRRISQLEQRVKEMQGQRQSRRATRASGETPTVAFVGYTNAGKSTLLNYLTGSDVLAEDKLFATLDPTVRRLELASGRTILFSDTVGFINKLPHKLVHAFKATLEEIGDADVLLHLIDVSDPNWLKKEEAVQDVLKEIDLEEKERVIVLNKIDQVEDRQVLDKYLREGNCFGISAVTGEGIPLLLEYLEGMLFRQWCRKKYLFSYEEGDKVNELYRIGRVHETKYLESGIEVHGEIPNQYEKKWQQWEM